jgi:hypothetical protein
MGSNYYGELGVGLENSYITVPTHLYGSNSFDNETQVVIDASLGKNFVVFQTSDHSIFSFGENSFGQLGYGDNSSEILGVPQMIDMTPFVGKVVENIACGDDYTLMSTFDGHVFSFGSSYGGQLGNNNQPPWSKVS